MPNGSSKRRPRDLNQLAASIVGDVAADEPRAEPVTPIEPEKDPAAVSLGRRGGLKGGKAPAVCVGIEKRVITGNPDSSEISISYVGDPLRANVAQRRRL